jgi:hypothetical protein
MAKVPFYLLPPSAPKRLQVLSDLPKCERQPLGRQLLDPATPVPAARTTFRKSSNGRSCPLASSS